MRKTSIFLAFILLFMQIVSAIPVRAVDILGNEGYFSGVSDEIRNNDESNGENDYLVPSVGITPYMLSENAIEGVNNEKELIEPFVNHLETNEKFSDFAAVNLNVAPDPEGIDLRVVQVDSNNENTKTYKTGEIMQAVLTFKANLDPAIYSGAYISIDVPSDKMKYVDSIVPIVDFSQSEVFSGYEKTTTGIKLNIKDSTDAREAEVPIFTKFKYWETPDGTHLPLDINLNYSDSSLIKKADGQVEFIGKAGKADYYHEVVGGQRQIGGISTDGKTLGDSGLIDVVFKYSPDFYVWNSIDRYSAYYDTVGARVYDKIILTQELPEFAVFDASKNPGWIQEGNNLIYTLDKKDYDEQKYKNVELRLIFPGAELKKTYTANSSMEFFPKDKPDYESTVVVNKRVSYYFDKESSVGVPYEKHFDRDWNKDSNDNQSEAKVTNLPTRINAGLNWLIGVSNTSQNELTITEFTDYELDARLYYAGVSLRDIPEYTNTLKNVSNMVVKAVLDDESIVTLGTVSTGRTLNFIDIAQAKRIKSLSFELPEGFVLNRGEVLKVRVISKFRDTPIIETKDIDNIYKNKGGYTGHYITPTGNTFSYSGDDSASFRLVAPKVDIGFKKKLSEKLDTGWFAPTRTEHLRADGELAIWEVDEMWGEDAVKGVSTNTVIKNLEIIDLLPEGLEYDQRTVSQSSSAIRTGVNGQIKYIENYVGSGLNAVVFSWDSITVAQLNRIIDYGYIKVVTKVTSDSLPGNNYNSVLVKIDGDFIKAADTNHMESNIAWLSPFNDSRDLNQNGNLKEQFAYTSDYYTYTSRYELIARKYIARGDRDNYNKDGLLTGPDTEYRYKLYNYNNKLTDISTYKLIDLFPYVGDYTPAKDATTNEFMARESAFADTLTGPLKILTKNASKFTIEYSTDVLNGKVENPDQTLNWSETVDDYSDVTAIRVTLKEGQTFKKAELLEIEIPMKAPSTAQLNERAWNDFVISTDNGEYVPTNRVYNEIYVPSGELKIIKTNHDGEKLKGAEFTVTSKADPTKVEKMITGEDGIASKVLLLGEYDVIETKAPENHEKNDTVYSVTIEESDTPELKITELEIKNLKLIDLSVNKVFADRYGDLEAKDFQNENYSNANIKIKLLRNGLDTGKSLTLNKDNNWSGVFEKLPIAESIDKDKYVYTVVEEGIDNVGDIEIEGLWFNSTVEEENNKFTVRNTKLETIDIEVEKQFLASDGAPLSESELTNKEVVVRLLQDGEETNKTLTLNVANNFNDQFTNLLFAKTDGDKIEYTVKEEGLDDTNEIKIDDVWFKFIEVKENNGNFTIVNKQKLTWTPMEPPTRDISVTKVWLDNKGEAITNLSGKEVELELYRNGEATGNKVKLNEENNFKYNFKNLPVSETVNGDDYQYTVVENGLDKDNEIKIDGKWYEASVTGSMTEGFTVTNKQKLTWTPMEPPTRDISVTKVWLDNKGEAITNLSGKEVELELYRNGEATGNKVKLNEENNFKYNFKNLPVSETVNGDDYQYTVVENGLDKDNEIKIDGKWYEASVTGSMTEGFRVTNRQKPIDNPNDPPITPPYIPVTPPIIPTIPIVPIVPDIEIPPTPDKPTLPEKPDDKKNNDEDNKDADSSKTKDTKADESSRNEISKTGDRNSAIYFVLLLSSLAIGWAMIRKRRKQ